MSQGEIEAVRDDVLDMGKRLAIAERAIEAMRKKVYRDSKADDPDNGGASEYLTATRSPANGEGSQAVEAQVGAFRTGDPVNN